MSLAARLFLEALRFDLEPEDEVRRQAERALKLGVGGFVLFGGEAERVEQWVAEWRDSVRHRLWIASDLERGAGQQFRGLTQLPPPAGLAACPDPLDAARTAGRITGGEARLAGVDLVLAPVLDLDVEPRNPIVGTRSFGSRPDDVARLGRAWIEACQAEGVGACGKHFPGHGRTAADSHQELPVVVAGRAELAEDLEPFRAVSDTVSAMMTAHVAYPALGSTRPATLEPRLLQDLLRDELGFEGIIVTDALNMGGFTGAVDLPGGTGDRAAGAIAALLAGCDLLLYPEDLASSSSALDRAALDDVRTGDRLEESLRRLEETARRIRSRRPESAAGSPARNVTQAQELAVSSVRMIGERPWRIRPAIPLRVVAVWDDRPAPGRAEFGVPFIDELERRGWRVLAPDCEDRGPDRGPGDGGEVPAVLLIASTPQAWKGTATFTKEGRSRIDAARRGSPEAWPIVFGHPRLLEELSDRPGGMVAWGTEELMERAAAARLDAELRRAEGGGTGPTGTALA